MRKPRQKIFLQLMVMLILLLGLTPTLLFAQQNLKGKVVDEKNLPLPGAGVKLKISGKSTVAGDDGSFTINAPENETALIVSFIGYPSQEIEIKSGVSVYNITLTPDSKNLNEVVVIGYGTQKRRDVTGSVVSLSGSAIKEVPVANIQQALQGRMAGVEVQSVGTRPGAGAQIRIRGERSINASNDPLFVVDGIPYGGTLNDINPDDIASLDVLKDASATAIYGSRGANGVVLITTKRGIAGDTRVSFNTYYGISKITNKYNVYDADQYRALRDYSIFNQDYLADEKQGIATGRNTDWQDLLYKDGFMTDNNLSISGGSEQSQFSVGGGYFKQTSALPSQDFTRASLKATGDFKAGKYVKIGFNNLTNYSITNGSQFGLNVFPLLSLSPLSSPYNPDGSVNIKPAGNLDDLNTTYNPLMLLTNDNQWVDRVRRFRTFNSIYGEVQILDGFKYRLNAGLDFNQEEGAQFRGTNSYFRPGLGNTASVNNGTGTKYSLDNLLTYEKTFAKKHRVSVTALFGFEREQYHNTSVSKDSITADFVQFYNLGQSSVGPVAVLGGSESSATLISMMLRANYVYNDRYMITVTGRRDGSSRLGNGNKWKQYPAVSAGWSISNEDFMKDFKVISNLKLRAGFGITSNQAVPAYSTLGGVASNGVRYNYGPSSQIGYYVSRIVDPNLDWEYTRTTNIGLDFGILNNRITGSIDYYTAKTDKLLYGVPLPPTSGISENYLTNIGNVENKGLEVALSSQNFKTESGFSWGTDLNFYFNRNKLIALNGNITQVTNAQLFVGEPLTAIFDYNKIGIWQTDEAAEAARYGFVPGQLKLEDYNRDGKLTVDDKHVIGNAQAKIQGGITNRFNFKGFDFSFVVYARFGGTLISQVHQPLAGYLTINDGRRNQLAVDYWTPTNPTNVFPSPNVSGGQITTALTSDAGSTLGYYDASFVKMRSINLGYSFTNNIARKLGAQKIKVYVTAQNPFIIYSPYVKAGGMDPEATGTGNQGVSNPGNISNRALTIGAAIPPTRTFLAGLNVTF
ncbi:TonB-dependent receptor [Pedobacter sp. MC2016-05]|uniref:SusC/RagA family TonB-linked outer membrane protein n=1 Tax=Pedobacter sp. MC2016-05 TaxID=2994474 RepID=UPI00224801CB|nr:TonB-dependent receptor [Pedobacter sp. MC2016-05]MCX2473041.1 TonB-dependent receptor [Pedobacter sp. MC2016-05]